MADEINVKVSATVDDFKSGILSASSSLGQFNEELNKAAASARKIDPDQFKALAQELNNGSISVKKFAAGIQEINDSATKAGEGARLSAGGMRELVVVAREISSGDLTRLPGSLSLLATRLNLLSPAGILGAASIAAVTYAIYEAINSSEKFEAELATIQNSLTAIGEGNRFDRSEITAYLTQLRQIPGVDLDAAESIVNEFTRSRNIGGDMMRQLTADIVPFSELIGKKVPEAAKEMASVFNDPVKGLALLKAAGVEVTAATREQVTEMMAVNNVAGAQKALLDGVSDAMSHMVDNTTGLQRFFNRIEEGFSGIDSAALATKQQLQSFASEMDQVGDLSSRRLATIARNFADIEGLKSRNLTSGSGGNATSGQVDPEKQAAIDREAALKKEQDEVAVINDLYNKGNSPLREQEVHKQNILKIQQGINAAEALHDDAAVKRGYADLETENKKFYGEPSKTPKAPKDNSDRDFENELAAEEKAAQQLAQAQADADERSGQARLRTERDLIEQKASLNQIDAQTEFEQLSDLASRELTVEKQKFDALAALYKDDAAKQVQIASERVQAEEKFNQEIIRLNQQLERQQTQAAQAQQKEWEKAFAPITKAFDTSIQGMVLGTQTFQQAIQRLGQSVVAEFVGNVVHKMVNEWLLGELQKTAASQIGANARQIADTTGANQSLQQNIETTGKQQETDAVGVYGNVFNYLSPELGPFAAVPAAVASAAVLALALPSAAGGMIVPNDTLAMVHENEMVLPARYTSGLTNMIDQANAGGGGGGHTFNTTVHANGRLNASDLDGLHDAVVSTMKKAARNGQFGGIRT